MTAPLVLGGIYVGELTRVGGWQVFLHNFLEQLVRRGHEVHLYGPDSDARALAEDPVRRSYRVHPVLPRRAAGTLAAVPRLMLRMAGIRDGIDVWQVVGAYPAGHIAARLGGAPVVLRPHGSDVQVMPGLGYGMRLNPKHDRRIRGAVARMDRVVALSPSMADPLRELGAAEDRIAVIPNGIELERFGGRLDRNERTRWAPEGVPLILTVGRNHPVKGFDRIPRVARRLRERGLDYRWLVVGPGAGRLRATIERERVADHVRLLEGAEGEDPTPDFRLPTRALVRLYLAADLFVFPTLLEGFPRVLAEAMAAGLAIVTTDAPGSRNVLVAGEEGVVVPARDDRALADAVAGLLSDGALRRRLSEAARSGASRYGWDRVVAAYEALYQELLGR